MYIMTVTELTADCFYPASQKSHPRLEGAIYPSTLTLLGLL